MIRILREAGAWVNAAVVTVIVAVGILVAGVTHRSQSETVAIPGCSAVIPEDEQDRINFAFTGDGFGGDFGGGFDSGSDLSGPDATVPWATPAGAETMTAALVSALPPETVITTDNVGSDLRFTPQAPAAERFGFVQNTSALGKIAVDGRSGWLVVDIARTGALAGPCFAGQVDERVTHPDGTVIDVLERGYSRRATLHTPDGFVVDVNADDDVLTSNQVADIASTRALRMGAL
ncbi:hypothetical protein [Rhodococcus sp. SORGH_AS_0301]|uniref:hypothetical protein n=1 Tax=Rhodococcus sp. SORGH_AS_0301 TaxID=3041780 RepID=UPI0027816D08|nr:hypothetical protein [Rhodococcus sp. SORGH_AS_0301]MDQ1178555.1 hypothetical protein [Rhodococcus sp. SORGH_AS_0301]